MGNEEVVKEPLDFATRAVCEALSGLPPRDWPDVLKEAEDAVQLHILKALLLSAAHALPVLVPPCESFRDEDDSVYDGLRRKHNCLGSDESDTCEGEDKKEGEESEDNQEVDGEDQRRRG